MDSFTNQPSGFKPYNAPPCPGCAQSMMPGQAGQRVPMQTSQPLLPPRPDLLSQTPTGIPLGPNYGTGPLLQPGGMPQQMLGRMPQQIPGGMPQQMPGGMPQQMPGGMPQQMPGGMPQQMPGGMVPAAQQQDLAPILPWTQPMPVTTESLQYMNGFMRTQIGRRVTIEFLIGTNTLVDKTGTLLAVGANYILINEIESDDILLCDFYAMKFIKFYY